MQNITSNLQEILLFLNYILFHESWCFLSYSVTILQANGHKPNMLEFGTDLSCTFLMC